MKKHGLIVLALASVVHGQVLAVGVSKYDLSFEQYKNTQVPKKLQNEFHRYYNKKLDKHLALKDSNPDFTKRRRAKIRCQGMRRIEVMHPATFRDIANKITRTETPKSKKKKIEKYIMREGYLNTFFQKVARSEKNVWGLTKKYSREAWAKLRSGVTDMYDKVAKPSSSKTNGKKTQSRKMKKQRAAKK